MQDEAWNTERTALLQKLWAQGATAAEIAAALRVSRSAVLGKIFRLRIAPADKTTTPAPPSEAVSRRRRRQPRTKPRSSRESVRGKTLLELTNSTCRWPIGRPGTAKFHFCGAAGADLEHNIPYCEAHMRRAYAIEAPAESVSESTTGPSVPRLQPALVASHSTVRPGPVVSSTRWRSKF